MVLMLVETDLTIQYLISVASRVAVNKDSIPVASVYFTMISVSVHSI
jgi:hypothetical protein